MESLSSLREPLLDCPGASGENGYTMSHSSISAEPVISSHREVHIEVCRQRKSVARKEVIEANVRSYLLSMGGCNAPLLIRNFEGNAFLAQNVSFIYIIYSEDNTNAGSVQFWPEMLRLYVYQSCDDGGTDEELEHDSEQVNAATHWVLPSTEFEGLWDSLVYDANIKEQLLNYAKTTLLFSDLQVSPNIVSWNRVILLHGPPGTGKTSLCKALANKLAIRMSHRYQFGQLIEINSHSLFSKWFSESGKLVMKMFQKIRDYIAQKQTLVCVLIDEVESLTAVRKAALSGSEPSDSIRVVNALLTQIDQLRRYPNVLILTTSNITDAIDLAFVDRADIRQYIGPPSVGAIYVILKSCLGELMRVGVIQPVEQLIHGRSLIAMQFADNRVSHLSLELWRVAERCAGLSGRQMRKLPFLAHARCLSKDTVSLVEYIAALASAAQLQLVERATFADGGQLALDEAKAMGNGHSPYC